MPTTISTSSPRLLTQELLDLGLTPQAVASLVLLWASMSMAHPSPVTITIEA